MTLPRLIGELVTITPIRPHDDFGIVVTGGRLALNGEYPAAAADPVRAVRAGGLDAGGRYNKWRAMRPPIWRRWKPAGVEPGVARLATATVAGAAVGASSSVLPRPRCAKGAFNATAAPVAHRGVYRAEFPARAGLAGVLPMILVWANRADLAPACSPSKSKAGRLKQPRLLLPHQRGWQLGAERCVHDAAAAGTWLQAPTAERLFRKSQKAICYFDFSVASRDDVLSHRIGIADPGLAQTGNNLRDHAQTVRRRHATSGFA